MVDLPRRCDKFVPVFPVNDKAPDPAAPPLRRRVTISGAVQGLGFRPYVYRLATSLHLSGWIRNTPEGVQLEIQGPAGALETLLGSLQQHPPPLARIRSLRVEEIPPAAEAGFRIVPSGAEDLPRAVILPDLATCPECLRELFDPGDRRYRYPFINCTLCGPRYSIIRSLPYDRPNTTMNRFTMCPECRREYEDPADRRFHAQPNACPRCGPELELWDPTGRILARGDEALAAAAESVRAGRIVALKGIGGFQLIVDARDPAAVMRLRRRKHREAKPFALMYPDLESVLADCRCSPTERSLLLSPQAPIVLLRRRSDAAHFADPDRCVLAPHNPRLGIMLPYSPLHHLLLRDLGFPVVATSGNLSEEPICIDEHEALQRLRGVADLFLVHNRPIERHVDDSVVCVVDERVVLLRRARGYAPLPVTAPGLEAPEPLAATGAHLKNTVAVARGTDFFVGQHVGDLDTEPAREAHRRVLRDLCRIYRLAPVAVACDRHPDYASTDTARRMGPVRPVQHHHAHVAAVMGEHGLAGPVLGVAWDGTGYGGDGTIWGGEFLICTRREAFRFGSLRPFPLPGGDRAAREPRRSALGVLHAWLDGRLEQAADLPPLRDLPPAERDRWRRLLRSPRAAVPTTSMGRLFDAVASLLGLRQRCSFEAQAAMELEYLVEEDEAPADTGYRFALSQNGTGLRADWAPLIRSLVEDVRRGRPAAEVAAGFHAALVELIVQAAGRAGLPEVVLCGGCFQNRVLLKWAPRRLAEAGLRVWLPEQLPANDGAIAFGQLVVAAARSGEKPSQAGRD